MGDPRAVSLAGGAGRKKNITRALDLIKRDLGGIATARNILIKPNLVAMEPDFANTHVDAIDAVIGYIRGLAPETQITVGESSATAFYRGLPTTDVFKSFNYYQLLDKYDNVALVDFDNESEYIESPIQSVVGDTHLRITKRVRSFDYKISLSIPKTHNFAMATFGIKNMAGLVAREDMATIHGMKGGVEIDAPKTLLDRLPSGTVSRARKALPSWLINFLFSKYPTYRRSVKMIHHNIAAFAEILWPELVVLDGAVCMEGDGPCNGSALPLDCAIASTDPLKGDSLGARLLGFEPETIGYIHYLKEKGLGDTSLQGLVGDDLEMYATKCRRHGTFDIQKEWR